LRDRRERSLDAFALPPTWVYDLVAALAVGLEWMKEALFRDVKQTSFAEIKDALQHYGAADLRKTAFIDRPPAR
jgi:hypothetical protein